jgi:vacuolar-type H+-ATPase subunit I/STV1
MSKFVNILLEMSFDISEKNRFPYEKVTDVVYTFKTGEDSDKKKYPEYVVQFTKDKEDPLKYERSYRPIDKDFRDLTNEGKALKVIATVTAITLDFMETNKNWKTLSIVPVNQKRYNILKAFFDKNKKSFSNYFIDEINNEEFSITKKAKK